MNRLCCTSKGMQAEQSPFALMAKPSDQVAGDDAVPIEICRSESSEFAQCQTRTRTEQQPDQQASELLVGKPAKNGNANLRRDDRGG